MEPRAGRVPRLEALLAGGSTRYDDALRLLPPPLREAVLAADVGSNAGHARNACILTGELVRHAFARAQSRPSEYSEQEQLDLSELAANDGQLGYLAGLLHDIGKARFKGTLTLQTPSPQALGALKRGHSPKGASLLEEYGMHPQVVIAARNHHGGPEEERIVVKLLRIADAVDAMRLRQIGVNPVGYARPRTDREVIDEVLKPGGFDPRLANIFVERIVRQPAAD